MARPTVVPTRVLVALIYGDWAWKEVELPLIVVPTTQFCRELAISPAQFQGALIWLEDRGLIESHQWRGHYATIKIKDIACQSSPQQ